MIKGYESKTWAAVYISLARLMFIQAPLSKTVPTQVTLCIVPTIVKKSLH